MGTDSATTRWLVGNTAATAPGARARIQCAASSTPAAVPRSQGWARTVIAGCPATSPATWAAWVTTTVCEGGISRVTRSRVWRSGAGESPAPPARTTAQRSLLESRMAWTSRAKAAAMCRGLRADCWLRLAGQLHEIERRHVDPVKAAGGDRDLEVGSTVGRDRFADRRDHAGDVVAVRVDLVDT